MKQVLVVDDQADLRRLVRWSLEMLEIPFTLHEANNGEAGLRMASVVAPDLMLLDVMMPGDLSGLDVCRQMRQDTRLAQTKIVLLSARGQSTDVQAGLDAGADAYVVKPFRPLQLVEAVEKLISPSAPAATEPA
jgi:two-component system phosphate regulon response regulator PhoB